MPAINLHRRPIYLRLSVTDRCNLRCQYCRPAHGASGERQATAVDDELIDLVHLLDDVHDVYKVRFTGGDPLVRPGVDELVRRVGERLPHVELALSTNAVLLDRYAAPLRAAGIKSLNLSLDTLDPDTCRRLTRGGELAPILRGIEAACAVGFPSIKINTVLMRTVNSHEVCNLVRYASRLNCELRFIELMPLGEGAKIFEAEYFTAAEALDLLRQRFEYLTVEPPSVTAQRHRFLVDGRETVVGTITTVSEPFCDRCDRLRLDSHGRLYPCLRGDHSFDLLTPWRAGEVGKIRHIIRSTIGGKHTPDGYWPGRDMVLIGG